MIVLRVFGWFLFFCAALFVVRDVTGGLGTDHGFKPKTVADVWNLFHPGAVDDMQGYVLSNYGHRYWWVLTECLGCWASVAFFVPGLLLELAGRPHVDRPYKRVGRKVELNNSTKG